MNKNILAVILGTIILSFTAFYNKFPLLTEDSATYINSGFKHTVPQGETALYGLFLAHSSWAVSIWLVVLCQAFLLSLILFYYFRYFSTSAKYHVYYLALIFFITFIMAASVSASTIEPGVFAGISMLSLGLLLFADNLIKRDLYIIATIAVISTGMDLTNLVSAILILLIFAVTLIRKQTLFNAIKTNPKRIAIGSLITFIAWLLVSAIHVALGGGFNFADKTYLLTLIAENNTGITNNFLSGIFNDSTQFFIVEYPWMARNAEIMTPVSDWFNWELREGLLSRQFVRGITFNAVSLTQIISSLICAVLFIYILLKKSQTRHYMLFLFSLASFIILLITNTFLSDINDGQSWQFMWLLALPAFLYLSEYKSGNTNDTISA